MKEDKRHDLEDVKEQWEEGLKISCVWMRCRTDLISLGLVRGGHVSQILDHLLGVLRLTSARLSSMRPTKTNTVKAFREGLSKT